MQAIPPEASLTAVTSRPNAPVRRRNHAPILNGQLRAKRAASAQLAGTTAHSAFYETKGESTHASLGHIVTPSIPNGSIAHVKGGHPTQLLKGALHEASYSTTASMME